MMEKEWRPVPGFDLYVCNKMGDIKNKKTGHVLSTSLNRAGYTKVQLYNNGVKKSLSVHTIIANVFLGERPPGYEVHHKDHDRDNPTASNLEYVTHRENIMQAIYSGVKLPSVGEENGGSKLRKEDIPKIVGYLSEGVLSQREIAERFGVSRTAISHIKRSITWKEETEGLDMDFILRCGSIERHVPEVRKMLASGRFSLKEIADKFGFSPRTIRDIKNGVSWRNIL